jgi:hypothetical protein
MSFVDLAAPPPAAGAAAGAALGADGAGAAAPAPPLAIWARAAAKISFVDLGAPPDGFGATGAGGVAGADAAAAGSGAAALGAASAGGVSEAPLVVADCARAAFRISSVESFFAIFSFTRNLQRDGSGGASCVRVCAKTPGRQRVPHRENSVSARFACPHRQAWRDKISHIQESRAEHFLSTENLARCSLH